ncbi:phosphoribosylanthranilate isomerase, partial [Candidatus Gottesmanbacteria bacterium]|nr:phosphoribosylanthranilate isomerase [Candidatus Gottesmanbacteria bacterium]
IQTLEAAQAASSAGADFLGFNFVRSSKRYIRLETAKEIIEELKMEYSCHCEPRARQSLKYNKDRHVPVKSELAMTTNHRLQVKTVGVFQNEKFDVVNKLVSYLKLDYVQLHGNESPEYISLIQGAGIIKSFSLDPDFDMEKTIKKINKHKTDYILLDREKQGRGELLNLDKVSRLTKLFPIFLSGGLNSENVSRVLRIAKPYAVDVAGGVEVNGKKDKEKIVLFIKLAKNYE